jgi:uncharacterized RDD family membrane protein YckC
MQCPSCRAVYSNGLSICPRCKTPASKSSSESETKTVATAEIEIQDSIKSAVSETTDEVPSVTAPPTSTLIEFPGVSRVSRPQWRKELSERVREIQERRARDSVREPEAVALKQAERPAVAETTAPQLGLVPQPDAPAVNPIVAAALKRLERARQPLPPVQRPRAGRGGGAATAAARIADEQYETETTPVKVQSPQTPSPVAVPAPQAKAEALPQPKTSEPLRERPLAVVPAPTTTKVATPAAVAAPAVVAPPASKPKPAKVTAEKVIETTPGVLSEEKTSEVALEEFYDDRAPFISRTVGSLIDLLVVAFASSPFAAIIELTNGNWSDLRVKASMGGIVAIVAFLYLTAATALAGRTWGMSLFSLRAVDAETGLPPTTKQSVGRAILYLLSLLTVGLGILYALFDVEGRTAHDHLSGTVVVRD